MRTFNETNVLRRNRRLIFQQNARHYLEELRFNQTESFDVLRRTMSDVQCMLESELNLEEAQTEENLKLFQPENRRFRDAIGATA